MGEFTHAMRNPVAERDARIKQLEAALTEAADYIGSGTAFDPPGSHGLDLALRLMEVLKGRQYIGPGGGMKCKSLDCALCHGLAPNAGPR